MPDELLDIFDQNNQPLGFTKPRSLVHAQGDWHRTSHIYVVNSQGQYLVHLRSPFKDSKPNCWDTRFGGHVMAGKSYEQTALEELEQEVGLLVKLADLRPEKVHTHNGGLNREHCMAYFYKFDGDLSSLKFNDNEVVEVKWMLPEEIIASARANPNLWPGVDGFLEIETARKNLLANK